MNPGMEIKLPAIEKTKMNHITISVLTSAINERTSRISMSVIQMMI
jgi:hypothetical protein